ncbi:hypothetical protein BG006_003973 [Podila minutissima]|uniref:N-acetyltransferase domain-containing protein n=1 Tax=Podila minutissima TaxID=64525 RepID=A0A9P5SSI9_9FUNG|nr:hypothetical protein BG006_003973 [Podila minutissima]
MSKRDQQAVHDLVQAGLKERWGDEYNPTYNKDLDDIYGYYVELLKCSVAVLEHPEQGPIGCGVLIPLPAKDEFGTWQAAPNLTRSKRSADEATVDYAMNEDLDPDVKKCRMVRVSVDSAHRGQGHAKSIVKYLMDAARSRGFHKVIVETTTPWISAVKLYESLGYAVVDANEENVHFEYVLE